MDHVNIDSPGKGATQKPSAACMSTTEKQLPGHSRHQLLCSRPVESLACNSCITCAKLRKAEQLQQSLAERAAKKSDHIDARTK